MPARQRGLVLGEEIGADDSTGHWAEAVSIEAFAPNGRVGCELLSLTPRRWNRMASHSPSVPCHQCLLGACMVGMSPNAKYEGHSTRILT